MVGASVTSVGVEIILADDYIGEISSSFLICEYAEDKKSSFTRY